MAAGDSGSGKSILLLQTVAQAITQDWIVIYVPQCRSKTRDGSAMRLLLIVQTWTDSSSPYAYNAKTQLYDQRALASALLQNILQVNGAKLNGITVHGTTSLSQFIRDVVREDISTVKGLERVMEVLAKQTE